MTAGESLRRIKFNLRRFLLFARALELQGEFKRTSGWLDRYAVLICEIRVQ